jgi:hypothetical protein
MESGPGTGSHTRATRHVLRLDASRQAATRDRRLFTGLGRFGAPAFSPDGTQVLLPWRDADQWLFLDTRDSAIRSKPLAIGDISRQFDPGASREEAGFPSVAGWCCS